VPNARILRSTTPASLRSLLADEPDVVVYEPRPNCSLGEAQDNALALGTTRSAIVLAVSFAPGEARSIICLANARSDLIAPLDCDVDLGRCVAYAAGSTSAARPAGRILHRIAALVPGAAIDVAVACAVLGQRRARVAEVAVMRGVPERSQRLALARLKALPATRQLGWTLSLTAAYRVHYLGQTEKTTAHALGLGQREAVAHVVSRWTRRPLSAWQQAGGFPAMLDAYADMWSGATRGSR